MAGALVLERIALGLSSGGFVVATDGEAERDRMTLGQCRAREDGRELLHERYPDPA